MSAVSKILAALLVSIFIVRDLAADDMQIAVSIRYLQIKGTSHAHIYLYTGDGKLIRELTRDQTGQDVDPVFAPEGREIVFTRKAKTGDQTWSVTTLGTGAHRVSAVPAWYQNKTEDTPRFTFLSMEWERWYKNLPEDGASPSPSPTSTPRPFKLVAPDGSVELILNSTGDNQKDYEEEQRGKLYRLRDLKSGEESLIGDWPGFETIWDPLHLRKKRIRTSSFSHHFEPSFSSGT